MLYGLLSLGFYKLCWVRVVNSLLIILANMRIGALGLLTTTLDSKYINSRCAHFFNMNYTEYGIAVPGVLLAVNIFSVALSTFGLGGYKEMGILTMEQVEFVETAILGVLRPLFAISMNQWFCNASKTVIVLVACPQVAAMQIPVVFEYAIAAFRGIKQSFS